MGGPSRSGLCRRAPIKGTVKGVTPSIGCTHPNPHRRTPDALLPRRRRSPDSQHRPPSPTPRPEPRRVRDRPAHPPAPDPDRARLRPGVPRLDQPPEHEPIAANLAANNPTAWQGGGDANVQAKYQNQIRNDAAATNCKLPLSGGQQTAPAPVFADTGGNGASDDIGDSATVSLSCTFNLITPGIKNIVGGSITVSASSVFPVKSGMTATGGGGGAVGTAPMPRSPATARWLPRPCPGLRPSPSCSANVGR